MSPTEENQPCSNGIGLTAKAELDQKRENGLSASNGGSVRLKFAKGFPKTEAEKGKILSIDETFICNKISLLNIYVLMMGLGTT